MNIKSRLTRLPWIAGAGLLMGSIGAVGWVTQYPRDVNAGPEDPRAKVANTADTGVFCLGFVDVETGLIQLGPLQPGPVTEVLCHEGQKVKKGDILLKVLDDAFTAKVREARDGIQIAQAKLDQAKLLISTYEQGVKQQQQAVEAAKKDQDRADLNLREHERLQKETVYSRPKDSEIENARLLAQKAKAAVTQEEAKLQSIVNARPDSKIREAEASVELQKSQLNQAEEALNRCTLRAPQDGTVLRILATVGTQYTPTSTQPAINFAPAGGLIVRAEVEQEFHHRVTQGATVMINDEALPGQRWHGKVVRLSEAFLPPRNNFGAPDFLSSGNNSRVREVIVSIEPSENMPKLGQKVRVGIGGSTSSR